VTDESKVLAPQRTISAAERIAELERRRADRRAIQDAKQEEQYAIDFAAFIDLEDEHGAGLGRVNTAFFVEGVPTMVAFRAPSTGEQKRFEQKIGSKKATQRQAAARELADSVLLYPDADTFRDMLQSFAGLRSTIALTAMRMAEGNAVEEGNG
jgi:hypothetical protein